MRCDTWWMRKWRSLSFWWDISKFDWQLEATQVRDLPVHKNQWRYFMMWNVGNCQSVAELVAGNTFNSLHTVRKNRLAIGYCYADSAQFYTCRKKEILDMGQEKKNQKRKNFKRFFDRQSLVETNLKSGGVMIPGHMSQILPWKKLW